MQGIVAEQSQQGALFTIVGQGRLYFDVLRDHKQVKGHQDILDIGHQVRSILDQFVDAHASRGVDAIGDAKDVTALFEGKIGRDQRPALFGRFCHQDAQRET